MERKKGEKKKHSNKDYYYMRATHSYISDFILSADLIEILVQQISCAVPVVYWFDRIHPIVDRNVFLTLLYMSSAVVSNMVFDLV